MKNEELIIQRFREVKALGWVESHRRNNTGIGKTFEDYVGVVENNLDEPDLFGYEIKAHRGESQSYVTLFTKSPSIPKRGANKYLNDNFGVPYDENPDLHRLHTSMFANDYNTFMGKLSFRLINDRENERITIGVYDLQHNLIDSSVHYTYESLRKIFVQKLANLFYVTANRRFNKIGNEEFEFIKAEIYTNPSFENFLDMIDAGEIMFDIRIGSYQYGKNYGKPHDHGSGFRIREYMLPKLYATKKEIE